MKKMILFIITTVLIIISTLPSFASNQKYCSQIGFEVDNTFFVSYQYNLEKAYYEYYDGVIVGKTTVDCITSHSREYSLGKKINLACIRVLTEPRTVLVKEKILGFISVSKEKKFGISGLSAIHLHNDEPVTLKYATTADSYVTIENTGGSGSGNVGIGILGFGINRSVASSTTKGICNCANNSTSSQTNLNFIFGKPQTDDQRERVYEQTYFYIEEATLGSPNVYLHTSAKIIPTYACGSLKASSTHYTALFFTPISEIKDGAI